MIGDKEGKKNQIMRPHAIKPSLQQVVEEARLHGLKGIDPITDSLVILSIKRIS